MIFKNVSEEDLSAITNIFGINSQKVKIYTEELEVYDSNSIKPNLILELDDKYQIIDIQSTKVDNDYSRRGHLYVSVFDYNKKDDKKVELVVLSAVEKSKIVEYKFSETNTFNYIVKSLDDLDNETIIREFQQNIEKKEIMAS